MIRELLNLPSACSVTYVFIICPVYFPWHTSITMGYSPWPSALQWPWPSLIFWESAGSLIYVFVARVVSCTSDRALFIHFTQKIFTEHQYVTGAGDMLINDTALSHSGSLHSCPPTPSSFLQVNFYSSFRSQLKYFFPSKFFPNLLLYSFIQKIAIEHLLYLTYYSWFWR